MDIELVIRTLKELLSWVGTYPARRDIERILSQLERWPSLSAAERKEIKHMLSCDMLFHVRWLGDIDVPGFVGDGTTYAWWNYLSGIAELCQKNL